jgi:DNA-binding IclR family transcriptional regulator
MTPLAMVRERGQLPNASKSAVRALEVLELLIESDTPPRQVDIARALGMSPSSADQILKTMVDGGYLLLDCTTKRYRLSPRLMGLASALCDAYVPQRQIKDLMRTVHERCGLDVLLAAPQNAFMQIVDGYDSLSHRLPATSRAIRTPFFGSCTGAAWLSTQDRETVQRLMRTCHRDLGAAGDDIQGVLQGLHRIREQGYAFGGLMADQGVLSIAVPLPPAPIGVVMVLIVSGAAGLIEGREEQIARIMLDCIEHILT